eukprot:gb/GECH01009737.1/.p1 GENE.gb/GECH01009737.1/~~gb/GECH01009737.1/.p1  ORF type:complete len:296 (+),score=71.46 gb/GECH01009737.1/:1-888(+)
MKNYSILLSLILFILFATCFTTTTARKPVVIMHGILSDANSMKALKHLIEKQHPDTTVHLIDIMDDLASVWNDMWTQAKAFKKQIQKLGLHQEKGGFHLIAHSQGGMISRAYMQTEPNHNVDTYIGLSNPLNGQYGDTSYLKYLFPHFIASELYHIFYTNEGQDHISIANYWKDPSHIPLYLKDSVFLPVLNNATANPSAQEWKENFLKLKKMVLIGGPQDGVITPWQSAHFGFFDKNMDIVSYQQQDLYKRDTFGLRTLDQRGGLDVYSIPGVKHVHWTRNQTVVFNYVVPYLS